MELRSADCACNPYLAFSLLLFAGLEGIRDHTPLCPPLDQNIFNLPDDQLSQLKQLPATLGESMDQACESQFLRDVLPQGILQKFLAVKKLEWQNYCKTTSVERFERALYFEKI